MQGGEKGGGGGGRGQVWQRGAFFHTQSEKEITLKQYFIFGVILISICHFLYIMLC